MPSILLCLLSDQRMQNILPLFQSDARYERVILLASKGEDSKINPRFERIAEDLKAALAGRVSIELYSKAVDPVDPASTEAICREIIACEGGAHRVTINFTGGTKPMSIGAYSAGLTLGAPMLYVDTQTEQMARFECGASVLSNFVLNPVSVRTVLAAHGRPVNDKDSLALAKPEYEELMEPIFANIAGSIDAFIRIQAHLKSANANPEGEIPLRAYDESRLPWLFSGMLERGMARRAAKQIYLNRSAQMLVNGGWLESYVFLTLRRSGVFMDSACRLKVAGVENELDVVATLNGKLGIIECKSGSLKGTAGQSTLNKLRALKETLGGTFGKSFLVTTSLPEDLSAEFQHRAREYVSRVVYYAELPEIAEIIAQNLSNRSRVL